MKSVKMKVSVTVIVVFLISSVVSAHVYFDDGLSHTIDYRIDDIVWVDRYSSPPGAIFLGILGLGVVGLKLRKFA